MLSYKLAKDIDGQLKQMVQDLKTIIDHLNTSNTQQQDTDDPVSSTYSLSIIPRLVPRVPVALGSGRRERSWEQDLDDVYNYP